ncbi:hypothetical protein PATSB16_04560 [Pandoraea thiooxydans]|nr:hypothetical protein PATSB16_04560 [Pandoraea thiooxydans]
MLFPRSRYPNANPFAHFDCANLSTLGNGQIGKSIFRRIE